MNATGKKMRKAKGLNRHELHKSQHARKSAAKQRQFAAAKKSARDRE